MSERAYPITEEEQLKRRILTPQPSRVSYSPPIDLFIPPPAPMPKPTRPPGCTFLKPCQLPDGLTHYTDPDGYVPLELISEYGHFSLLGGREMDTRGAVHLRQIGGSALPVGLGQLALRTVVVESAVAAAGSIAAGLLAGVVGLAWPGELGDSALYSEEQLHSVQRARSQMRLHTGVKGGGKLRPRRKEPGYIYEWDFERGKVEKYTKRGKHLGEFDPITGERTKDADDTRRIDP